ncbi:hypothetical protein F4083_09465 [Candidatus Poribacteria bacterium]|nr:hypothetical protein [Candidatus Poribacteria bacterium]MYF56423.1 hypothetical protein [Candidatus Poribacteria bacterium]MYI94530.1 hypothetical protein [Candidatus Poribacteria bacterium]
MRILLVSCCLILLLLSQAHIHAKILFVSEDPLTDRSFLYVMDDDGSNVTRLSHQDLSRFPRWSPDGKQIVFYRRTEKNSSKSNIFIMNAEGRYLRQLTFSNNNNHPSFSPDGKSIVFNYDEITPDGNDFVSYICLMDLESGIVKKIANVNANNPTFSPDGRHIVFSGVPNFRENGANVWIMSADGGNLRELLPPLAQGLPHIHQGFPKISPDGKHLLYFHAAVTFTRVGNVIYMVPQAYRYFIYDLITGRSQELKIPKDYKCAGLDWMDGNKAVVFSAFQTKLDDWQPQEEKYALYKYDIWTREITLLKEDMIDSLLFPDWISDDVLSVSPKGKKTMQWGQLKAFLNTRYKTLKTFSSGLSDFFLQYSR